MTDDPVKTTQLGFPFEVEVVLHHLEKNLDVPPLAINPDDLLIGKINIGGQDRQPLTFLAVTDKDDFYLLLFLGLDNYAGKNLCLAWLLFQFAEQTPKVPAIVLGAGKTPWADPCPCKSPANAYPREGSEEDRGERKPTVHQDIIGSYPHGQHPFDHSFQVVGGFDDSFHPTFVTAAALVQLLI